MPLYRKDAIERPSSARPAARNRGALLRAVCSLWAIVMGWAAPAVASTSFAWIEAWRHTPIEEMHESAVGDALGGEEPTLVSLVGHRVNAYGLDPEGPRFIAPIEGFPERPTALAVADYDGDGVDDVWIGTEAPGLLYVFTYSPENGSFVSRERIRYAWTDVVQLRPLDLDGFGMTDVAAVNREGGLSLFRWTPGGYERVDAPGIDREVRFLRTVDLDADGRDELVLALGADRIAVAGWRSSLEEAAGPGADPGQGRLEVVWENYVWGTHAALFTGDFDGAGGSEVVILSSRGILTRFGRDDQGRMQSTGPPVDWPGVAEALVDPVDIDRDGRLEIVEAIPNGLQGWGVGSSAGVDMVLATSSTPVERVHPARDGESLIVTGGWGFAYLEAMDPDYVRVLVRGDEYPLLHPPLIEESGDVFLSAHDWARLLGTHLKWDAETGRIVGVRGFHFIVGEIGGAEWVYDGRPMESFPPPKLVGDVLYLPADFGRMVGADMTWEPYSRTLVLSSSGG